MEFFDRMRRMLDAPSPDGKYVDYHLRTLITELENECQRTELRLKDFEEEKKAFEEYKATELFKMLQTIPLYKEVRVYIPKE